MRIVLILFLLLSFLGSSFANIAHAATQDIAYPHSLTHVLQDTNSISDTTHSEQDKNSCDECCCIHAHNFVLPLASQDLLSLVPDKKQVITVVSHLRSISLSGIKRPPRF